MSHELVNDTNIFFKKYVEARYYASLKREVYIEKKVELEEEEFTVIQDTFEERRWNKLKEPCVCSETLTSEFYVNVILQDGYKERKS